MQKLMTSNQIKILIVDDQAEQRLVTKMNCQELFENIIGNKSLEIIETHSPEEAFLLFSKFRFDIILLDKDLGEHKGKKLTGMDYIQPYCEFQPWAQIIMLTADLSYNEIARSIRLGANDYLMKDSSSEYTEYRNEVLKQALLRAKRELEQMAERGRKTDIYSDFACKSPAMQFFDQKLKAVAESSWPLLFLGASGLGKGSAARRVSHYRRQLYGKSTRPFVNINIGAMADNLAQTELFGHEPHAFTGAGSRTIPGLLDIASGGDIFLDEIGDASPEMQLKLLKVVEEREYKRVGGRQTITTDARFIFATNKNLKELMEQGKFRADLYMRISAFELQIPNLDDRKEDLPEIIKSSLRKVLKDMPSKKVHFDELPDDLVDFLTRDQIQGNIRGIENDVARLVTYAQPDSKGSLNLKEWRAILGIDARIYRIKSPVQQLSEILNLEHFKNIETNLLTESKLGLKQLRDLFEKKLVEEAMKKNDYNLRLAALNLKVATSHLHTKMKQYNIPTKREVEYEIQKGKHSREWEGART